MPVVWVRTISMTPFFQGVGHLGVARTLVFSGGGGGQSVGCKLASQVGKIKSDEDLAPSTMKKVERRIISMFTGCFNVVRNLQIAQKMPMHH
jgi:hypothetical protein